MSSLSNPPRLALAICRLLFDLPVYLYLLSEINFVLVVVYSSLQTTSYQISWQLVLKYTMLYSPLSFHEITKSDGGKQLLIAKYRSQNCKYMYLS